MSPHFCPDQSAQWLFDQILDICNWLCLK
jgi:hypothetical protein